MAVESYALIKDNTVVNVALAENPGVFNGYDLVLAAEEWTSPGDVLIDGQLPPRAQPEPPALEEAAPEAPEPATEAP